MAATRRCPRGRFYRKTYTRKGRRIFGRCIRKQTRARVSSRNFKRAARARMTRRMRGVRMTRRGVKNCPRGYILRGAYMRYTKRGRHVLVPAACIKDVGAAGKGLVRGGPGIGILRKGDLTRFGYEGVSGLPVATRRASLRKAVAAYGPLATWRKLNAVAVYTRRSSPKTSRAIKADMDWIRATWGLKAF